MQYEFILFLDKYIFIGIGAFETCYYKFKKGNKRGNKSPTEQKIEYSALSIHHSVGIFARWLIKKHRLISGGQADALSLIS